MKLNYKKVIFVGFAFFLILAFWQAYDAIVPLMLVNKFGLNQTVSGVIMALDNVLAVFMLPLFGSLSDRTKSKYGKRTPYIVLGTIVAICAFIGLSFMDNLQLNNLNAKLNGTHYQEMLWEENMEVSNGEYNSFTNQGVVKNYSLHDYAAQINFNKNYDELTDTEKEAAKSWYLSVDYDTTYYYNKDASAPYSSTEREGDRAVNAFSNLVTPARNQLAFEQTKENPVPLIFFIILLLVTLIAMATFRSPAVALMPDVTIKPLRSQANAVINLLGTAGGIFVLVLGMVFGTSKASNQMMSFTWYIVAVCAIMALGLALFILKVREPKWAKEMEEDTQKYCPEPELQEAEGTAKRKLDKSHLTSLLLILRLRRALVYRIQRSDFQVLALCEQRLAERLQPNAADRAGSGDHRLYSRRLSGGEDREKEDHSDRRRHADGGVRRSDFRQRHDFASADQSVVRPCGNRMGYDQRQFFPDGGGTCERRRRRKIYRLLLYCEYGRADFDAHFVGRADGSCWKYASAVSVCDCFRRAGIRDHAFCPARRQQTD